MSDECELEPFPCHGLVPKRETGAERFLTKYPEADGRGVVIAIFDTGVDPGAPGLQETPDGHRKILDLIDTTGSGDVDTSTVRKTEGREDRVIDGLTGRKLRVPDEWENPSGEWHVGVKAIFQLFPNHLKGRLQNQHTKDVWEPKHNPIVAQALRELAEFDTQHPATTAELSLDQRLERENLQAKVDLLNSMGNTCPLNGPLCDCVVFNDGHSWSAVLDTTECGDLASCTLLKPYRESGQFTKFGDEDMMNYSVNIHDNGNVLSIVATGGSHGTHVASIAAAYFPDKPEMNGVAPGAQLVCVKIGDSRLSTMETASSLIRAAIVSVDAKVDLINLSYGEASQWANKGAVLEQFTELCDKHNIIFVTSAGNNGPALSTVGCPGGNTASLIGIGAFVSPDMMAAEYSMTQKKPGLPYTWSSRGPAIDGDLGVSVTAPGGAVTSVPNWTLQKSQLMNGTSMSSPNACGCIALLLSALKSQGISYTPALVKRTIESTAAPLGTQEAFSVGHGVLQVDKAYEQVVENQHSLAKNVRFTVNLPSQKSSRGLYLREPYQLNKPTRFSVVVEAKFPEDTAPSDKLQFEMELALVCSQSWVQAAKHLVMWNGARQFTVEVDPRGLESGAHYAEVCAYDSSGGYKGPLFRVPITAVIPTELTDKKRYRFSVPTLDFVRNKVHRYFFHVPEEASWADVELVSLQSECRTRVTVHSVQLLPDKAFREQEVFETLSLDPDAKANMVIPVVGGITMELCLTQYWSELKDASVSLTMTFHSLQPSKPALHFHGSTVWTSLEVTAAFDQEELCPEFKLSHHIMPKRPTEHQLKPLGSRDVLPSGTQIYELVLTYSFHMNRNAEVRPNANLLSDLLYECPYGGQLWLLFDSNKQLLCAGDAYPRQYSAKVEKGDYTLKLQVRHHLKSQLEHLKDMPILLELKLSSAITMETGSTRMDTLTNGSKFSTKTIKPGKRVAVYVNALSDDKLPKHGVQQGEILAGRFTLSKVESVKKKLSYPLVYTVGPKASKASSSKPSGKKQAEKTPAEEYAKALKELKLQWMKSGGVQASSLEAEYGDDIDFLLAKLRAAEGDKETRYSSVEELASKIRAKHDMVKILAHSGTKTDLSNDATSYSSEMDKAKNTLVECLLLEGSILVREDDIPEQLRHVYVDLHKLLDQKDSKLRSFRVKFAEAHKHYAIAAKLLEEEMNDKGASRAQEEQIIKYYRKLGWEHCAVYREKWLPRKFPEMYEPF